MTELKNYAEGKQTRCPAEVGLRLGILEEDRNGQRGMYVTVLYNEAAQHFIVDNLDAALSLRSG